MHKDWELLFNLDSIFTKTARGLEHGRCTVGKQMLN